jgi:hypothetical protein
MVIMPQPNVSNAPAMATYPGSQPRFPQAVSRADVAVHEEAVTTER